MGSREYGLYEKYKVERLDGKPLGLCIVLPLEDPNSWEPLLHWADVVEEDGYTFLAADIRTQVEVHREMFGEGDDHD